MNRLSPSSTCRVCAADLWALRGTIPAAEMDRQVDSGLCDACQRERFAAAEMDRQVDSGLCDACQRERFAAAVEFEHAAADVRLWHDLGAWRTERGAQRQEMTMALKRAEAADARCVALKMWPATRA